MNCGKKVQKQVRKSLSSGICAQVCQKNPGFVYFYGGLSLCIPPPGRAEFLQIHWGRGGGLAITVTHETLQYTKLIYTSNQPNQQPALPLSTAGAWLRPIELLGPFLKIRYILVRGAHGGNVLTRTPRGYCGS